MTDAPATDAEVLADFLSTDVQDYQPRIDEIAQALASRQPTKFAGNAYELTLTATYAVIHHTQTRHPAVKLPVATFRTAFEAWIVKP